MWLVAPGWDNILTKQHWLGAERNCPLLFMWFKAATIPGLALMYERPDHKDVCRWRVARASTPEAYPRRGAPRVSGSRQSVLKQMPGDRAATCAWNVCGYDRTLLSPRLALRSSTLHGVAAPDSPASVHIES